MGKSQTETYVEAVEKFAETEIHKHSAIRVSIEHDLRGKNRAMVIRVLPAVTKSKKTPKGQPSVS